jgi:hypothetical protein
MPLSEAWRPHAGAWIDSAGCGELANRAPDQQGHRGRPGIRSVEANGELRPVPVVRLRRVGLNGRAGCADTRTGQPPVRNRRMPLPFDTFELTDNDLLVLASYASAEQELDKARKAAAQRNLQPENGEGGTAGEAAFSEDVQCEFTDPEGEGAQTLEETCSGRSGTWIPRRHRVEGVPADRLAPAHGRLIAHGYLQFQLQGRDEGLLYRLTGLARQALAAPLETSDAA